MSYHWSQCQGCGLEFPHRHRDTRYCSDTCSKRASRAVSRDEQSRVATATKAEGEGRTPPRLLVPSPGRIRADAHLVDALVEAAVASIARGRRGIGAHLPEDRSTVLGSWRI